VIGYLPYSGSPWVTVGFVAHRVVSVTPQYLFVQGDNRISNPTIDPQAVFPADIVGKIVARFRLPW